MTGTTNGSLIVEDSNGIDGDGTSPSSVTAPFFRALSKIESTYEEPDCQDDASADTRKEINSNNKSLACACIITLCKILDNIILERKYNPKTRSIKLSNKLFQGKVGKVLGGVDILMACKFTYNTVQSDQGHSIQLKKHIEDRKVLIIGRKYLDLYGQRILKLQVGKHKNELPPFVIQDKIDQNVMRSIESDINSLSREKLRSLEDEISAIIEEDSLELNTKDIGLLAGKKDCSPSSPDTESTSNSEGDLRSSMSGMINDNNFDDDVSAQGSLPLTVEGLPLLEKVKQSTEIAERSVEDDSKDVKNEAENLVIRENFATPIPELSNNTIMQHITKDLKDLSNEEKETLDAISKFGDDGNGDDDEEDMIVSVVDGKPIDRTEKQSRTYGLMKKLKSMATSRNKEKEEKKTNIVEEEASIVTHTTQSDIRIKDSGALHLKLGMQDVSVVEEDIGTSSLDMNFDIDCFKVQCDISEDDDNAMKTGLKLFFVVITQVFSKWHCESSLSSYTPLEIVYRLWNAILRSELELKGIKTHLIFEAFRKVVASSRDSIDQSIRSDTLSEEDLMICNFISQSLAEEGLIQKDMVEMEGLSVTVSYESIRATSASYAYGEELAHKYFDGFVTKKISTWHGIIVRGCNETLESISRSEISLSGINASDLMSLFYAGRLLPYHIFASGHSNDAISLLLDRSFLMHRYTTCSHLLGTLQHLNDAELIIKKMKETGSNDIEFGRSALEAVHDIILEELEEKKKEIDIEIKKKQPGENEMSSQIIQAAHDIGCALHHLGLSMGKSGWYQKERDVYSEALRLKLLSGCSNTSIAETTLSMSICYRNLGDLWAALTRCKDALSAETKVHGENHISISKIFHRQGILLSELEEYDDALICFQKSLSILKIIGTPPSDEGFVKTICWIGKVQRDRGDFLKALGSFRTAQENIVERDHIDLAEIYQNIGVIYDDMEKYDKSLSYLYECLKIRRLKFEDDSHPDICETLSFIASVFKKTDVDKALTIFRFVLDMKTKSLSLTKPCDCELLLVAYSDVLDVSTEKLYSNRKDKALHDEIATLFFKIGSIHEKLHQYHDAVLFYNKSLKIRQIRKDYNDIGVILNSLGIAHAKRRSFKKAFRCFSDSLAIRKTIFGDKHKEVAETLHNMGNCAAKRKDFDNASIYYEQSLIIKKMNYGDMSESTAKTIQNIGMVNEELGLLDDAFNYYRDALRIRTEILDQHDLDIAFSLHSVGTIHRKKNEISKAQDCFTKALHIKKQHYIIDHLSIAETLHELAITLSQDNKLDEAVSNYESALSIYEKLLGAHKTTIEVLSCLGTILLSLMRLDASYRYLERALVLKRMLYSDDDESISDILYLIGKVQGKSGDLDDALDSLKEALRIRKQIYSEDSLPVAAVINDVGVLQLRKGQYAIARTCFSEAIRVWKLKLDNPDYLGESLMNLAEIDYSTGKYDDAVEKLEEALTVMKSNPGDRDMSVALAYFKLGLSLKMKKSYVQALDVFDRSLMIRSAELGDRSIAVAEVLKNIGTLCLEMGEFPKARNYLGESLQIMTVTCPNDLETADTLYNLGKVMIKMKCVEESKAYFEEALDIRRRRIDSDDTVAADIITELATILEETRQFNQSLLMHQEALKIRESILGEHESVGDSYHMIGNIEQSTNQYEAALKSFGSALVVYQNTLGDDHLSCARTMNNIGIVLESMNDCNEALKYHREALRIRKKHLGQDHLKVANSLDNIAGVFQKQNNVDKASAALKEALRIRISKLGNDHLEVATTLFGMGIVYCDKGDLQRAMDCYEASLKIRKKRLGASSIEVAQTLHNIGSLHAMRQDYKNALKNWKSALEKYKLTLGEDHHMVACTIGNIQMAENCLAEA